MSAPNVHKFKLVETGSKKDRKGILEYVGMPTVKVLLDWIFNRKGENNVHIGDQVCTQDTHLADRNIQSVRWSFEDGRYEFFVTLRDEGGHIRLVPDPPPRQGRP